MKILLIDGMNLIRRIEAALPRQADGGVVFDDLKRSVSLSLTRALSTHVPSHVGCVFDGIEPSWRHDLFPAYKANRAPMPESLRVVLGALRKVIEDLGVHVISESHSEADDVIATMTAKLAPKGANLLILSTDTGFCQLLDHQVQLFDHFAGELRDGSFVERRFGVTPVLLTSYLALAGVSSSNIPGVKGVGPKTASQLVRTYGDLDEIILHAAEIPGRFGTLITEQAAQARLAWRLVTLKCDVRLNGNLRALRFHMR